VGHAGGDLVLQELADRLRRGIRPGDVLARIGGDEFLALLPDTGLEAATRVAERLRALLASRRARVGDHQLTLTASMGLAPLRRGAFGVQGLLAETRAALERSKASGKNRVSSASGTPEALESLCEGLRRGEGLRSVSHPIIDTTTSGVVGYEMLVRGPAGPWEQPDALFRVAMDGRFLAVVDLHCATASIGEATRRGYTGRIQVNLFPSALVGVEVERLLAALEVGPQQELLIEVSETRFVGEPTALRQPLDHLRQRGILVAVDDVGFGRTALETLVVLAPDQVKIDRRYVDGVGRDAVGRRRLRRLLSAVRPLTGEIVAEGVERPDDLAVLVDLGVDLAQGYLWGTPR